MIKILFGKQAIPFIQRAKAVFCYCPVFDTHVKIIKQEIIGLLEANPNTGFEVEIYSNKHIKIERISECALPS